MPKEVKQFSGLIGYYRKFMPRFSDIVRSLTNLTRHDTEFIWMEKCDRALQAPERTSAWSTPYYGIQIPAVATHCL